MNNTLYKETKKVTDVVNVMNLKIHGDQFNSK